MILRDPFRNGGIVHKDGNLRHQIIEDYSSGGLSQAYQIIYIEHSQFQKYYW